MKLGVGMLCMTLMSCQTVAPPSAPENEAPKSFAPKVGDGKLYRAGDTIAQKVRDIGGGFYYVDKEIQNPPKHWEGIAHFTYLYYHDVEICRCERSDVVLSKDKKTITFPSIDGLKQEQIDIATGKRETLFLRRE